MENLTMENMQTMMYLKHMNIKSFDLYCIVYVVSSTCVSNLMMAQSK